MEYNTDRPVKKRYRTEIVYWCALVLINPVINTLNIFFTDPRIWPALLLVSIITLPLYMLFTDWLLPKVIQKRKRVITALSVIASFIAIHLILFFIYKLITGFSLSPYEKNYFQYSGSTIIRESVWIMINLLFATGIYFIKTALDEKDMLQTLQQENNYFKLRYLRTQLNPHFLFNTLNSIYSLSLQKSDATPEAVVKLADIMRYLIYECNEDVIPLDKEIEFIKNYIAIEQIRFDADIKFTVEGATEGVMIEPFVFISFIENGFKYALDNTEVKPFVYITLIIRKDEVVLNVINNTNIDLETQAKRIKGKGITGSKSLLELLYPSSYTLDIIQTDKSERQESRVRMKNARERLEALYPDAYTLDVLLNNNVFTVSLILKTHAA